MRASEYPGIPDFGAVPVQMLRVVTTADCDTVERDFSLLRYTQFPKLTVLRVELSMPWCDGCRRAHRDFDISPFHKPDLDHRDWTESRARGATRAHLCHVIRHAVQLAPGLRVVRLFGDARARLWSSAATACSARSATRASSTALCTHASAPAGARKSARAGS